MLCNTCTIKSFKKLVKIELIWLLKLEDVFLGDSMIKQDILKRGWTEAIYQNFLSNKSYATLEQIEKIEISDDFRQQTSDLQASKLMVAFGFGVFSVILANILNLFLANFNIIRSMGIVNSNQIIYSKYVVFFYTLVLMIAIFLTLNHRHPIPERCKRLGLSKRYLWFMEFSSNMAMINIVAVLCLFPLAIIADLVSRYVYDIPVHLIQMLLAPIASTMTALYIVVAVALVSLLQNKDMNKTYQNHLKSLTKEQRIIRRKARHEKTMKLKTKKELFLLNIILYEAMALPYLLFLFSTYSMN